jgi:hypothetical protein
MNRREFLRLSAGAVLLAGLPAGCGILTRGKTMKINNLKQPPYNTTLMGVLKGAVDYFNIDADGPMVFGISGHAFLINIHEQLCPSGPYCWQWGKAYHLIKNLGVLMTDLGFYSPQNSKEDRAGVEKKLRDALSKEIPCSLCNMENQLITGYDDEGIFTAQPWAPKVDFPQAKLSFGTWKEFGDEFHVNFFTLEKVQPADRLTAILESLDYAVDLYRNPAAHNMKGYGIGPDAYVNWVKAVPEYGSSHGNWWNATVWSECRTMASKYFAEIGKLYNNAAEKASQLEKIYAEIGAALSAASNKEMDAGEKVKLLEETKEKEATAVELTAALAVSLRADS